MKRKNSVTSATVASARSRVREPRRHPGEPPREGGAGADASGTGLAATSRPAFSVSVVVPFRFGNIDDLSKEGLSVPRELKCSDLMPGCNFVAQGKDDSEVMKKTAEHARSVHKMVAIAMDVERKARAAIRDTGGVAERP